MYNSECSTPSLFLDDDSSSSIVESINSRHSYNTRLSAKLKAVGSRRNSCSKNILQEISPKKPLDADNNSIKFTFLNAAQVLLEETEHISTTQNREIMRRRYAPAQPALHCNHGLSCMERFCKYLIKVVSIGCLVVICTYLTQRFQIAGGSQPCFNNELSELKSEIGNMKKNMHDVFSSKDDTEKKLEVIEQLLRDLKKTTHINRGTGSKCPAKQDSKKALVHIEIKDALKMFAEDETGRRDFALEATGGTILETRDTEPYPYPERVTLLGYPICSKGDSARALIQSNTLPGQCWAFKGSRGCAIIALLGKVQIAGVSLEHISVNMSPSGDIKTAPRDFTIKGMTSPADTDSSFLGRFTYDIKGPRIQYFETSKCDRAFDIVEFRVLNNHGHPDYTCVYRLRIHGDLQK